MERFWTKNYPAEIPKEIDENQFESILEVFEQSVSKFRGLTAFENMGVQFTFEEIEEQAKAFAAFIQNHTTLKPGDRIGIQLPNVLQFPIVFYGSICAGLTVVNINPLYTAREMEHQFKDSGIKAIIILENFADKLEKVLKNTKIETVILTEIGDCFPLFKRKAVNFAIRNVKKMVPKHNLSSTLRFRDTLKMGRRSVWQRPTIKKEDIAILQYTGGTTGVAKGAMLTHRNLVVNMEQMCSWIGASLEDGKEISLTCLPMYHIFCLTVNCLGLFKIGANNILITNPRDLKALIRDFDKAKPSIFMVVNTLVSLNVCVSLSLCVCLSVVCLFLLFV